MARLAVGPPPERQWPTLHPRSATIPAVSQFDHLPDSRQSLLGITAEGDEAWLIRGITRKLYRCPGCHGEIGIGDSTSSLRS